MAATKELATQILNKMNTSKYYTCDDFMGPEFKFLIDTNTNDISTMLSHAYWEGKLDRRDNTGSNKHIRFEYLRRDSAPRVKPVKKARIRKVTEQEASIPLSLLKKSPDTPEVIVKQEEPLSDLETAANYLEAHIRNVVMDTLMESLEDLISQRVGEKVATIMSNLYSGKVGKPSDQKIRQKRIVISGLLPDQAFRIKTEYSDFFKLSFHLSKQRMSLLDSMIKQADNVLVITSVIGHDISAHVKGHHGLIHCNGMLSSVRVELDKLR